MEPARRTRPRAFMQAAAGVLISLAGAGAGWAAHDYLAGDRDAAHDAPRQSVAPAKDASATAPTPPAPPAPPPPPALLREGGVTFEDDDLVRRFLGLSVRCGYISGHEFHASLLDFLQLRTKGYGSPPFHYDVRHIKRDAYDYVVVREELRQRDGKPFPGAPGYVAHSYYFDEPLDRFQLAHSTPEDPDFNRAMLRELGDPLGFMGANWQAVCNGALRLHRASARSDGEPGEASPPGASGAPEPQTGVGQWSGPL